MSNWLCDRGWHKLRPRYSETEPQWIKSIVSLKRGHPDMFVLKKYEQDVCVRCGFTTRRTQ